MRPPGCKVPGTVLTCPPPLRMAQTTRICPKPTFSASAQSPREHLGMSANGTVRPGSCQVLSFKPSDPGPDPGLI